MLNVLIHLLLIRPCGISGRGRLGGKYQHISFHLHMKCKGKQSISAMILRVDPQSYIWPKGA